MNALAKVEEGKALTPSQQFRVELDKMVDQFAVALPSHIKPEKFHRVVMTAVLSDPAVLKADRKTLMESAIRAAQDGLLPDKREGAFVVFNTKVKIDGKDEWINAVQWMPMIGGIIKKIHQSDEIAMLTAKVVYGGDTFRAWVDDDGEHVAYEQAEHPDYDTIRQVFALAKTKDGAVYVETLTPRDIDKIRSVSRSKDKGPWVQWWEEMAKKSAIRRLAKRLPLSSELHDLMQRDNELYDLSQAPDPRPAFQERLAAAKASPALTDAREGFDREFVARETQALSEGQEIDQEPASDHPPSPSETAGSASENPTSPGLSDDATEPAEPVEAGAEGQEQSEPAPASEDRAACIKAFMRTATDKDLSIADRRDILEESKDWWKEKLPTDHDFVRACLTTADKVAKSELAEGVARKYLETLL